MPNRTDHIEWTAEAVSRYQVRSGSADDHAIADLICDLGHLAADRGLNFIDEMRRGVGHWYAEQYAKEGDILGPDAAVEIIIMPK